jgi:hypothetical protein
MGKTGKIISPSILKRGARSVTKLPVRLIRLRAIFRFYLLRIYLTQINSNYLYRLVAYGLTEMTPIHRFDIPGSGFYDPPTFTTVIHFQLA